MAHRFTSYREMLERAHAIWYQKANAEQHSQLFGHKGQVGKRKWNGQEKEKGKWQNKKTNIRPGASKAIVPVVASW